MTSTIQHGPELFRFTDYEDWVNRAPGMFKKHRASSLDTICVDAKGRLCMKGKEFMRAKKENTYPIIVYRFEDEEEGTVPA
jgi:hypothetical protein